MLPPQLTRREVLACGAAWLTTALPHPAAGAAPAAKRDGRIRLADGRWLGYREYGQPSGAPVFYFHGIPGSRLELAFCDRESRQANVRIIAVDRPGMGRSSYQRGRRITAWPDDVEQLAAALGYPDSSFGVAGMSGGAPYAAVCAAKIPHRLTHVALVSGHAPLNAPHTCPGNQDQLIALMIRRQRLGRRVLEVIGKRLDRRPEKVVARIAKNWSAADRNLVLCNPRHTSYLIANLRESIRCGAQGLVTDICLLGRPWGFCLPEIQDVPVSIWQGGCDPVAPPSMGHYFHRQIAGSELILDKQAGHVTMLKDHASEILARFVA